MPDALGIGLDTGGTFTDVVLYDLSQRRVLRKAKTPTTHADYTVCVGEAFARLGLGAGEAAALRRVVLSTTLATNAVAEGKVHPTGMVVEPGDIRIPPGFHPHLAVLRSQLSFDLFELQAVSEEEVLDKTSVMASLVEGFAVSGYAATRDARHEERIAAILRAAYGKPVVLGSELTHRLNFLQRARAAALNAGLLPVILEWLEAIRTILSRHGIACPLYLVKGDGSLMEEAEARRMPVHTLFSGPAASLNGGGRLTGRETAVVIDVGGTTTDVGEVHGGTGRLRAGGVRIEGRSIAVDGLDIATFGLGGDSRLRLAPGGRLRFANDRVLPFCRTAGGPQAVSPEALEPELDRLWHFGDPELLELLALDPHSGRDAPRDEREAAMLEALRHGPRREKALQAELRLPGFGPAVAELLRRRALVRIGLTPTDLFCAEGHIPAFSREHAQWALEAYARMLDREPAGFRAELGETLRRQTGELLIDFLAGFEPPLGTGSAVLERLGALLMTEPERGGPRLSLEPGRQVVLVGAGAPLLFARAPGSLQPWLESPADAEVANAVGAIASRFLLRESVTLEPVRYGGVELFDHHGKRFFPSLAEGLERARRELGDQLVGRARELGLAGPELHFAEEVMEDYEEFSRRGRRELVIARLHATLSGMPAI